MTAVVAAEIMKEEVEIPADEGGAGGAVG